MLHARKDYNERIQDKENKIPKDEPVFLLRGQDALAIGAMKEYLRLCEAHETNNVEKVKEHLQKMMDWKLKKMPDTPKNV